MTHLGKRYVGDGVYAELEGDMIKLTTEDGESVTNTIYLEDSVFWAIIKFRTELVEHFQAQLDMAKDDERRRLGERV